MSTFGGFFREVAIGAWRKETAAGNAARVTNHSYGTDRDDYTKIFWPTLADGSIDALMKYVAKNGYKGLPAIAPFLLPSGNGNSGTDG